MTIQNTTTYDISPLEYLVKTYLPTFNGIIAVKTDDRLLDKFSADGVTLDAFLDRNKLAPIYTLSLRAELRNTDKILCHEFCHLRQMEEGRLTVDMTGKTFAWEGKTYSAAYPYNSRPWEVEAFKDELVYLSEWRTQKPRKCLFTLTHK